MQKKSQYKQTRKPNKKQGKRPFTENDFKTVLKAVTKPLKKEQGKRESGKT